MAIDDRDNLPQQLGEHAIGGIERGRFSADHYQMDRGEAWDGGCLDSRGGLTRYHPRS